MAVIGDNRDVANSVPVNDGDRLLADLLPQARGKSTLIGGTIESLDHVRDRFVVRAFGGRNIAIIFDNRTRVYRDGVTASLRDLQSGQRVYLDTALAGTDIFARSVRVLSQNSAGQSSGQVLSYDAASRELALRDVMAGEPAKFVLSPNASVLRDGKNASPTDLQAGSLVTLKFNPSPNGPALVKEVSILASPGANFVFSGRITHLDLHLGLLVLVDPRDQKSYDIHFDPNSAGIDERLREGAEVVATTSFDGARYTASNIVVNSPGSK